MKASDTYTNLAWQAEINEVRFLFVSSVVHRLDAARSLLGCAVWWHFTCQSGDILFRYRNVAYQLDGVDAGEGRRQNIYVCGGGDGALSLPFPQRTTTTTTVLSDRSRFFARQT
jgi:hypothetical protein